MWLASRGFHRRAVEPVKDRRVPPGQYVTADFPVMSAGPTAASAARIRTQRLSRNPRGPPLQPWPPVGLLLTLS
jgi:hypothetical protein